MRIDSGRAVSAMDFEMRTFRVHFDATSHIRFDAPSILSFFAAPNDFAQIQNLL